MVCRQVNALGVVLSEHSIRKTAFIALTGEGFREVQTIWEA